MYPQHKPTHSHRQIPHGKYQKRQNSNRNTSLLRLRLSSDQRSRFFHLYPAKVSIKQIHSKECSTKGVSRRITKLGVALGSFDVWVFPEWTLLEMKKLEETDEEAVESETDCQKEGVRSVREKG
jgi:hypothetical protein